MRKTLIGTLMLIIMILTACTSEVDSHQSGEIDGLELEQVKRPKKGDEIAIITTNIGEIKMVLFSDIAPNAVDNFKQLVEEGYYDYLIFGRIVEDYLIQIQTHPLHPFGKSVTGDNYDDEVHSAYCHITGAVGMAKNIDAHSDQIGATNSNFYIIYQNGLDAAEMDTLKADAKNYSEAVLNAYEKLGGLPNLDGAYTVFAQVYSGLDLVREINQIPVDASTGIPSEYITIMGIEIERYEE